MRGKPRLNFDEFERVAEILRREHEVISPAEMDVEAGFDPDQGTEGFDMKGAIFRDLNAIAEVDAVVLLPDWESSKGVRAEKALAEFLGIQVYTFHELPSGAVLRPLVSRYDTVLDEAKALIYGSRNVDYGHPSQDFARTAMIWSGLTGLDIQPYHVPMMMIGVKLSRMVQSPGKRDHSVDIAGYAGTLERLWEERMWD